MVSLLKRPFVHPQQSFPPPLDEWFLCGVAGYGGDGTEEVVCMPVPHLIFFDTSKMAKSVAACRMAWMSLRSAD